MKSRFLAIFVAVVLMTPFAVAAQEGNPCTTGTSLGACVSQVYVWSLGLSVLLALCATVYGGFVYMTAQGNGAKTTKGKSYIYSSIVGLVLLFGAYLLLNTINSDLTNFTTASFEDFKDKDLSAPATTPEPTTPEPTPTPTTPSTGQ